MRYYSEYDLIITPLYLLVIVAVAYFIRVKNRTNNLYKFFVPGLIVKLIGALAICLVYTHYYGYGGDTFGYHNDASTMINLGRKNFFNLLTVLIGSASPEKLTLFDMQTGYPGYWTDTNALNMVKLIVPLEFLTFCSFPATALLMAVLGFSGLWKFYLLLCDLYPNLYKHFAFSVFFIPSVVFWGSGILKDTITISAICWYCYTFYELVIKKNIKTFFIISMVFSVYVMISVKPYAFVALLPGSVLWGISGTLKKIKNILLKILFGPIITFLGLAIGLSIWLNLSSNLGRYSSLESMIDKAHESQKDLKSEYYHGNSFDIGEFEKTPTDVLSKLPEAIIAGLFRPFIWEARNIQMVVAGLENLFILLFTLFFLIKVPISFFKQIFENPLVLFCVVFSLMFAFAVGLSTSNFGALERFKIPIWPFYLSSLFIINHHRIKFINKGYNE